MYEYEMTKSIDDISVCNYAPITDTYIRIHEITKSNVINFPCLRKLISG